MGHERLNLDWPDPAGCHLFNHGGTKLCAYEKLVNTLEGRQQRAPIEMSRGQAVLVGLLEIAGALGVIMPAALTPAVLVPDYLMVRLAASGLALLMVAAGIYHVRR